MISGERDLRGIETRNVGAECKAEGKAASSTLFLENNRIKFR